MLVASEEHGRSRTAEWGFVAVQDALDRVTSHRYVSRVPSFCSCCRPVHRPEWALAHEGLHSRCRNQEAVAGSGQGPHGLHFHPSAGNGAGRAARTLRTSYSDNDISLLPGQSKPVVVRVESKETPLARLHFEVACWNCQPQTLELNFAK
jgi:hypothetical protein